MTASLPTDDPNNKRSNKYLHITSLSTAVDYTINKLEVEYQIYEKVEDSNDIRQNSYLKRLENKSNVITFEEMDKDLIYAIFNYLSHSRTTIIPLLLPEEEKETETIT